MNRIRGYLFLGLTAVLVAVIGSLMVQSRRREAQPPPPPPATLVRAAKPTPTRVVRPPDLEIVEERATFAQGSEVRHRLVIRNSGRVVYRDITVEIDYLGRSGARVETRRRTLEGTLAPGAALAPEEVVETSVAAAARKARVTIVYADIEPSSR